MHALKELTRLLTTAQKILWLETIVCNFKWRIMHLELWVVSSLKFICNTIHKKIFLQMLMSQAKAATASYFLSPRYVFSNCIYSWWWVWFSSMHTHISHMKSFPPFSWLWALVLKTLTIEVALCISSTWA